jgi:hypothetical protein
LAKVLATSIASWSEPMTWAARVGRGKPGTPMGCASFGLTTIVMVMSPYRGMFVELL